MLRRVITWTLGIGLLGFIGYGLRPRPIEVEIGVVARGPLTVHVVEEGKTRIRNRYVVSAPVAGQMRRVPLKNGDPVKAGETIIARIEPAISPLLDPRTKAEAEARLQAIDAGKLKAAQALDLAHTAEKFALQNWERAKKLVQTKSISDTDRDNTERDYEMRARETRAAEFALKIAEYELAQAKAALMQIETPGDSTTVEVRSPVSGFVLRVMQESATIVTPGVQILEVGDKSDIEIEAEILSRDAVAIKPGAAVSIEQWGGEKPLDARVRLVEPAAFTKISALGVEEQRVIVLSDLVNPPAEAQKLGDRYRVEVRVSVWHGDDVLLVPAGALFREGSEWKTFVFEEGIAHKKTLEAGHSDGRMTEVIKGLTVGAEVLLHPPDTVKDGSAVQKRTP
ncbi:MAG: HlyD family efflux transporter periplasmic adaptor subunit [Verrucomicrobia bacterium]|nr:HlyD family efflux transporter periplasmic adaptor subunit [Verrucomicrobiota bacterium]